MLDRWRRARAQMEGGVVEGSWSSERSEGASWSSERSEGAWKGAEPKGRQRPSSRFFCPYLLTVQNALVSRREPRPPPRNRRAFMVLAHRQEYRCAGCRELLHPDSQADHVVPWSLSGDDADGNVQILCPNCHAAKSAEELPRIRRARDILMRLQADRRGELEGLCWGCMHVRSVFCSGECGTCST
jgi:5-methylcytosine-specific restriction endonuclease McrA